MPAKKQPARQPEAEAQVAPGQPVGSAAVEGDNLIAAAYAVFEQGGATFTTREGKEVTVKPAKMKQITKVMKFFADVAGTLQDSDLVRIIDAIANKQREYMAAGKNPRSLDIRAFLDEGADIVKGLGNISLVAMLMHSITEYLPELVESFTNVSKEEFSEFDLDETAMVVFGIITVNYDFFTRRVLPLFAGFIQSLARERLKRTGVEIDNATKSHRRR